MYCGQQTFDCTAYTCGILGAPREQTLLLGELEIAKSYVGERLRRHCVQNNRPSVSVLCAVPRALILGYAEPLAFPIIINQNPSATHHDWPMGKLARAVCTRVLFNNVYVYFLCFFKNALYDTKWKF